MNEAWLANRGGFIMAFMSKSKSDTLKGKKIAILATDGFEQAELFEPKKALENAGAEVEIISFKTGKIKSWNKGNWGKSIAVNHALDDAHSDFYDALLLPGGVINADKVRGTESAVRFVKDFVDGGKPIAAICHAPWILIEAEVVKDHHLTSWPSLQTDLRNAGAEWTDEEVVVDEGLVTSRKPDDIPAFNEKMIDLFASGVVSRPNSKFKSASTELRH
jgi:protease I